MRLSEPGDGLPATASVVIPAWRRPEALARCLAALPAGCAGVEHEVIVVLNGSPPAVRSVAEAAAESAGEAAVRIVDSPQNLGFGGGTRLGASFALGSVLVFLNDDATPEPGWLARLVATADEHPEAGAVGSLLLGPDGRVEELGCSITEQGWGLQRFRDVALGDAQLPTGPVEVDYCSGAALLVWFGVFGAAGGFDPRYHPAYFEDVDLGVTLRQAGLTVLAEPRAVVVHERGGSSEPRFRDFLTARNHERFVAKWRWPKGPGPAPGPFLRQLVEQLHPAAVAAPAPDAAEASADRSEHRLRFRSMAESRAWIRETWLAAEASVRGEYAEHLQAELDRLLAEERGETVARLTREVAEAAAVREHDHADVVALSARVEALQRHIDGQTEIIADLERMLGGRPLFARRRVVKLVAAARRLVRPGPADLGGG